MQQSLPLLSALPCWFEPAVINGPVKQLLTQIGAKKGVRTAFQFNLFLSAIFHILQIEKSTKTRCTLLTAFLN